MMNKGFEIIDINDRGTVIKLNDEEYYTIPHEADKDSWQPLVDGWSKDKQAIYLHANKIGKKLYSQIDFASFAVLDIYREHSYFTNELETKTIYFRDCSKVYIYSYMCDFAIIEDANPDTFVCIDMAKGQASDGKNDFRYNTKLPYKLKDAIVINDLYCKANNMIYFSYIKPLPLADCDSFEVINGEVDNIARDKNHVYYQDTIIEGANPQTFEFLPGCIGKDKAYYRDCDIDFYAKDDKQAYFISTPFMAKVIKTKSLANFRFVVIYELGYAFDDNYRYERGKRKKL